MKATMTLPVLDFSDVGRQLKRAGGNIRRFADVEACDYAGYLGSTLSFRMTVLISRGAYLSICSHQIAHGWFGVRAALHMGSEELPCAAWMISDAKRSALDDSPALCIRCLRDCDGDTCPYSDVEIRQIPLAKLHSDVIGWTSAQLR